MACTVSRVCRADEMDQSWSPKVRLDAILRHTCKNPKIHFPKVAALGHVALGSLQRNAT